jgi:hypothetical protein
MLQQTFDADAVLKKTASEIVVQGENLRAKVRDLTLQALQARELSLTQITKVLRNVTDGVNKGAATARIDVEKPLADALDGMDDALLQVVQASRIALERLLDGGADFQDSKIRKAIVELNAGVLAHMPAGRTDAGAQAEAVAAKFAEQTHTALRKQREGAAKLTHSLVQNYGTLTSGILIGLSEGLKRSGTQGKATAAAPNKAKRGTGARA